MNNKYDTRSQIIKFNKIFKKYNETYQDLEQYLELNRIQTGVLYTLEEFRSTGRDICTQKDITEALLYSKQSVNNAVKQLRENHYIEVQDIEGNKKSKNIVLTQKGDDCVRKQIKKIIKAEDQAFKKLSSSDRENLLFLFEKITQLMKIEFENLIGDYFI